MTINRTVDANIIAEVLEEIMLNINNPNYEIYSAREGVVDIIHNFTQEFVDIPYREPTDQDYNDYAFMDYDDDIEEDDDEGSEVSATD